MGLDVTVFSSGSGSPARTVRSYSMTQSSPGASAAGHSASRSPWSESSIRVEDEVGLSAELVLVIVMT